MEKPGYFTDSLIKIDTETGETTVWMPCKEHLPTEPIFVEAPGATREDDGVLLSVVMDSIARHSALVVLNSTTMSEIGRASMPIVMPYGFHGNWGWQL